MATHSSILALRIPWTEEPGGLQSIALQRVRHDWTTNTSLHMRKLKGLIYSTSLSKAAAAVEKTLGFPPSIWRSWEEKHGYNRQIKAKWMIKMHGPICRRDDVLMSCCAGSNSKKQTSLWWFTAIMSPLWWTPFPILVSAKGREFRWEFSYGKKKKYIRSTDLHFGLKEWRIWFQLKIELIREKSQQWHHKVSMWKYACYWNLYLLPFQLSLQTTPPKLLSQSKVSKT